MAALVGMVPDDPGFDSLGADQLAGGRMARMIEFVRIVLALLRTWVI